MPARPDGRVRIVDTSRSPNTVIATVRGIGVAVRTSTCGAVPFARSVSRCSTPNRCCSSMTTSPRSAKVVDALSSACVPTTMRACPDAARRAAFRRSAAGSCPVRRVGMSSGASSGPSIRAMERTCWAASTSVGAMSADCPPDCATCSIARRATRVLPEPTSPCTSRFIGQSPSRSCAITSPTARWSSVRSNGSRASKRASRSPAGRAVADIARTNCRCWSRAVCRTNASCMRSVSRAGSTSSRS